METIDKAFIKEAVYSLIGGKGKEIVEEIYLTNMLSEESYRFICNDVLYNGSSSVIKYFGVI